MTTPVEKNVVNMEKRQQKAKQAAQHPKSVETLSENVDVVKRKRSQRKKDLTTMKKHTKEAIPLAVASQVAEVSSTVVVETKGKKKSPKKAPTQRTTENEQEKKPSET